MNETLVVFYYAIVAYGIIYYLTHRRKGLSMSDFIMAGITILFSFSGVINSYGIPEGYKTFDMTLYILYSANALIIPIGLIWGKKVKVAFLYQIKSNIRCYTAGVSDKLLYVLIAFIIAYAIGFFVLIRGNVPLLLLMRGKDALTVAVARLQVTHNLTKYYNVPFIFRYYTLVFSFLALYSFSILFIKYLNNKGKYRIVFILYTIVVIFLQFYATEKAPVIYLFMIIVFDIYMVKVRYIIDNYIDGTRKIKCRNKQRRVFRRMRLLIGIGIVGFVVLYSAFMGIGTYNNSLESIFKRAFIQQSSSVYLQKITLDSQYNGCLYGKGVTLTILDSLLGRTPVNLSRIAYAQQYLTQTTMGGTGAAGSIGIFYFYANYGMIIAMFLLFAISLVTGMVDRHIDLTTESSTNKELPIAFNSMLLYVFFQGYLGHFQTIFQLPFIIAPQLFIILVMTYYFKRFRIK